MDQENTIANTPQSNARRTKRDTRILDSPKQWRIPGPQFPPLSQPFQLPVPPVGPLQFNDPFQNNYASGPLPIYCHLPANLAQAVAQLPPLQPVARGRRGRPRHTAQNLNWAPVENPNILHAAPSVSICFDSVIRSCLKSISYLIL